MNEMDSLFSINKGVASIAMSEKDEKKEKLERDVVSRNS